jgi:hypothetical protein
MLHREAANKEGLQKMTTKMGQQMEGVGIDGETGPTVACSAVTGTPT